MLKCLARFVFVAAALSANPVWACRGNTQVPPHGHAAGYEVLAVEVTGVHLTAYEQYRAATLKLQPWPKAANGEDTVYPTSSTPSFGVNVLVHGSTSPSGPIFRELTLGGCGVRVPGLKERGLLFIAHGGSVGVLWADREPEYTRWLEELGLAFRPEP